MSMLKLNRKNLHCSPQSPASFVFLPPSPVFSQNSWPRHKPTDSLQNTAVYLASVEMKQKSEKKSWNGQSGIENEEREREVIRERGRERSRPDCSGLVSFFLPSLFFFFFFSVSNDSQRKEKASSLSSVELNISFLLERQEGNTQSSARTHTHEYTQRKALTSGFFAAREIRSST